MNSTANATTVFASPTEVAKYTSQGDDPYRVYRNDGPLTPVHYIIIVLMIYMGGIAVLIMKSVQKDNEVLRYAHYYENFVKRPQFNRPQLLPSYSSEMMRKYSQNGGAQLPKLPVLPDESATDDGNHACAVHSLDAAEDENKCPDEKEENGDELQSVVVVKSKTDDTSKTDFV